MTKKTKILLIYTGGTIGMIRDYKNNALKPFDFDNILKSIPELNHLNCEIITTSFKNPIDSSNMNTKYWIQIASIIEESYSLYEGFVILTGSDTMAYTSSAISFMLENLNKPVIFTGSQLPIGDIRTDAKENLITAIQIASYQKRNKPILHEVCLYFEYKLYRANRTTKINSEHFEAFTSPNYPPLAESGVYLKFNTKLLLKSTKKEFIIRKNINDNIAILKLFPGITINVVQSILNAKDLKGVVLETYGSGNASTNKEFINTLKNAIKKGITIVNVTQCISGGVNQGQYETSTLLKKIGIISGKDITTESAIAKLMYLLGQYLTKKEIKKYFEKSLRGEISS